MMKISNDQKRFFAITRNFSQIMRIFCRSREIFANDEKSLQLLQLLQSRHFSKIFDVRKIFRDHEKFFANHERFLQITRNFCKRRKIFAIFATVAVSTFFENFRKFSKILDVKKIFRDHEKFFANHERFLQITRNFCKSREIFANHEKFLQFLQLLQSRHFSKIFENFRNQKRFFAITRNFSQIMKILCYSICLDFSNYFVHVFDR